MELLQGDYIMDVLIGACHRKRILVVRGIYCNSGLQITDRPRERCIFCVNVSIWKREKKECPDFWRRNC